jgi:GT2 family glycosyltransferase
MPNQVTIVVVPRDHYSSARASLEQIYANTLMPFDLIYVDHSGPADLHNYLKSASKDRNFDLIHVDRPLAPNEARNLAIPLVRTPFTAFVDNDAFVERGWLEPLVKAAETHGSWIVAPTYLIDESGTVRIHIAGGTIEFQEEHGQRYFAELHHYIDEPVEKLQEVAAGPTDFAEFHAMLVRTDIFEQVGTLDENMLTQCEHLDLCMTVTKAGGKIRYEPASTVTYRAPARLEPQEVPYFLLRWSDQWNASTIESFCQKWSISENDPYRPHLLRFLTSMRRRMLSSFAWPLGRILELMVYRPGLGRVVEPIVARLEHRLCRELVALRAPVS